MGDLQEYDRMPLVEMRERIMTQLKLNFAHDNIDEAEFERRIDAVAEASSKRELAELVRDLPVLEDSESPDESTSPVKLNRGRVQESDAMFAILGGTDRKGVWRPARKTSVVAFMGGIDLDFTQAEMVPGTTEISIFTLMGGVDIKVPPELDVEVTGIPILGGIDNHSRGNTGTGPLLRVKVLAIMGGVDIKVAKKKK
jgi:hypothetical protein